MQECVFCRIARGEIPVQLLWDTPAVAAFRDANPQAPIHILIVPKKHVPSLDALQEEDGALVGELFKAARELARREGCAERGYRVVINTGADGGQTVPHLHLHLMAGREFGWPAG